MTDQQLIEGIQSGDQGRMNDVFRHLYKAHYSSIQKMILKRQGSRADAADVFQNALLVLLEKVEKGEFKQEASLGTYLFAISRNLWLKELRKKARKADLQVDWELDEGNELIESDIEAANLTLLELLGRLDPGCEKILIDYYFHGADYDEIARALRMTNRESAKIKKFRCLRKLIKLIKDHKLGVDSFKLED